MYLFRNRLSYDLTPHDLLFMFSLLFSLLRSTGHQKDVPKNLFITITDYEYNMNDSGFVSRLEVLMGPSNHLGKMSTPLFQYSERVPMCELSTLFLDPSVGHPT